MAIKSVTIELDRGGVGDLLASAEVQDMLNDKAEQVANAARGRGVMVGGETAEDVPLPIVVVPAGNTKRARTLVVADHPAGLAVEAKHRLLAGSLDAAR